MKEDSEQLAGGRKGETRYAYDDDGGLSLSERSSEPTRSDSGSFVSINNPNVKLLLICQKVKNKKIHVN